ncbi:hypothetical protein WDU94_015164 [Cyamophila willieti]
MKQHGLKSKSSPFKTINSSTNSPDNLKCYTASTTNSTNKLKIKISSRKNVEPRSCSSSMRRNSVELSTFSPSIQSNTVSSSVQLSEISSSHDSFSNVRDSCASSTNDVEDSVEPVVSSSNILMKSSKRNPTAKVVKNKLPVRKRSSTKAKKAGSVLCDQSEPSFHLCKQSHTTCSKPGSSVRIESQADSNGTKVTSQRIEVPWIPLDDENDVKFENDLEESSNTTDFISELIDATLANMNEKLFCPVSSIQTFHSSVATSSQLSAVNEISTIKQEQIIEGSPGSCSVVPPNVVSCLDKTRETGPESFTRDIHENFDFLVDKNLSNFASEEVPLNKSESELNKTPSYNEKPLKSSEVSAGESPNQTKLSSEYLDDFCLDFLCGIPEPVAESNSMEPELSSSYSIPPNVQDTSMQNYNESPSPCSSSNSFQSSFESFSTTHTNLPPLYDPRNASLTLPLPYDSRNSAYKFPTARQKFPVINRPGKIKLVRKKTSQESISTSPLPPPPIDTKNPSSSPSLPPLFPSSGLPLPSTVHPNPVFPNSFQSFNGSSIHQANGHDNNPQQTFNNGINVLQPFNNYSSNSLSTSYNNGSNSSCPRNSSCLPFNRSNSAHTSKPRVGVSSHQVSRKISKSVGKVASSYQFSRIPTSIDPWGSDYPGEDTTNEMPPSPEKPKPPSRKRKVEKTTTVILPTRKSYLSRFLADPNVAVIPPSWSSPQYGEEEENCGDYEQTRRNSRDEADPEGVEVKDEIEDRCYEAINETQDVNFKATNRTKSYESPTVSGGSAEGGFYGENNGTPSDGDYTMNNMAQDGCYGVTSACQQDIGYQRIPDRNESNVCYQVTTDIQNEYYQSEKYCGQTRETQDKGSCEMTQETDNKDSKASEMYSVSFDVNGVSYANADHLNAQYETVDSKEFVEESINTNPSEVLDTGHVAIQRLNMGYDEGNCNSNITPVADNSATQPCYVTMPSQLSLNDSGVNQWESSQPPSLCAFSFLTSDFDEICVSYPKLYVQTDASPHDLTQIDSPSLIPSENDSTPAIVYSSESLADCERYFTPESDGHHPQPEADSHDTHQELKLEFTEDVEYKLCLTETTEFFSTRDSDSGSKQDLVSSQSSLSYAIVPTETPNCFSIQIQPMDMPCLNEQAFNCKTVFTGD